MTEFGAALTEADLAELGAVGHRRRLRPGTPIFIEGTRSDTVTLILTGRVKVFSTSADGTETLLAVRGPGALLGELAAIDGKPRTASVVALEPVEQLVVGSTEFVALLHSRPKMMWQLLRMVTGRLRDADTKRGEFAHLDTLGRVARRLVELAETHGEPDGTGVRITVPLTQEELAGWVGSSREATAKALRTLRDRGLLQTQRREITVLDLAELRRRGSG